MEKSRFTTQLVGEQIGKAIQGEQDVLLIADGFFDLVVPLVPILSNKEQKEMMLRERPGREYKFDNKFVAASLRTSGVSGSQEWLKPFRSGSLWPYCTCCFTKHLVGCDDDESL